MKIFSICFLAICFVLSTSLSSSGAEDDTAQSEILTLSLGGGFKTFYYMNAGKISALNISDRGISTAIKYSGSPVLAIYINKKALEQAAEGKGNVQPDFVAEITQTTDRHLLVFIEPKKEDDVASLQVYGISSKDFKAGDYRVINMTAEVVQVDIHETSVTVSAGEAKDILASAWKEKAETLNVKLGIKKEGKVKGIYSSLWGHKAEQRSYLFLLDSDDKYRPVTVKKYYDVPSVKALKPVPLGS